MFGSTGLRLLLVFGLLWPLASRAGDPNVQLMGETFVSNLPAGWHSAKGNWNYVDIATCYKVGNCYGNNPSSPYGFPVFHGRTAFQMEPSDAVVIFFRTPPEMRYFGFTQYLFSRGARAKPITASLSDTLNQLKLTTLQSIAPVQNVFNQYAVLVWTADMNSLQGITDVLVAQGIQASQVNFLPLPFELPLHMGHLDTDDTFSMLMRFALPTVQADFDSYVTEKPFFVVQVGPNSPPAIRAAPMTGYAATTSGTSEPASDGSALNSLVADIRKKYKGSFVLRDQTITAFTSVGWDCIAGTAATCTFDTHDALYSVDSTAPIIRVGNERDIAIVAGVNHQLAGKALYQNHSVTDPAKAVGIIAVDDRQLTAQSALFHAGVQSPTDPRVDLYRRLYAYAFSYDCNGIQFCTSIPPPTPENPVGLKPGAPFILGERLYVDPHTGVRPDQAEIFRQQVLIGTVRLAAVGLWVGAPKAPQPTNAAAAGGCSPTPRSSAPPVRCRSGAQRP